MADNKKSSLLQAVNKLKAAKKSTAGTQNDGTKSRVKNSAGDALKGKIKDAVSKFEGDN